MEQFNFDKMKEDAKKVIAGAAIMAAAGTSAMAQETSHLGPLQPGHEHVAGKESDAALLKQVSRTEKEWEAMFTKRGIDNPKSFTIVSRSDLERSLSPFSSPLNDKYVTEDIMARVSENHIFMSRDAAGQNAMANEYQLEQQHYISKSEGVYTKVAYYFVVEQDKNPDGTVRFVAKMISTQTKEVTEIGSVTVHDTIDTLETEKFFDDEVIPTLYKSIENKINQLELNS